MLVTLVFLAFGFFVFSVHCCSENILHGYLLDGFTTEKIPNIGVHVCIKECLLRRHCMSINYNKKEFACEIKNKTAEISLEGTLHSDYIFANVVNSSEISLGNCRDWICPSSFKCVNTHDSVTCISTACAPGTYGKDGQCIPCSVGQYSTGSGLHWCSMCQPGSYQDQFGSSFCHPCPAGTYQTNQGKDTCLSCSTGRYSAVTGSWQCRQCPPGTYQDTVGSSHCKLCPAGTYQPNYEEETAGQLYYNENCLTRHLFNPSQC
ncbi:signal peptide, CUB and EGF-like domain-containing protein 1 [Saccostrea cucullata]|uniref:signal peptide, CUB and EGF-like domain-containing protein 1 n=1 Tax=Saccostrea cuccullata TaxID=36930 RepID=UPI002ED28561